MPPCPTLDKGRVLSSLDELRWQASDCCLIDAVRRFVESLPQRGIPTPSVAESSTGQPRFDWEFFGNTLTLEFRKSVSARFRQRDLQTGAEHEHVDGIRNAAFAMQMLTWFTAVRCEQAERERGAGNRHNDVVGMLMRLRGFGVGVRLADGIELPCGKWTRYHHRTRIFCIGIPEVPARVRFNPVRKHKWPTLMEVIGLHRRRPTS